MLLLGVSAICLIAAISPASAVTMQAVYSGSVSTGTDQTGIFGLGLGEGALNDADFTLTFTYNPSRLGVIHEQPTITSNLAHGGPFDTFGSVSPIYFADLVINGITQHISANGFGFVGNRTPGFNSAFHSANYQNFTPSFTYENYVGIGLAGTGLNIPLDLETNYQVIIDSLVPNGQFDFNVFDNNAFEYTSRTFGNFNATALTVSTVPLPGALPLFAAGLIGLGAMSMKRANRKLSEQ